MKKILGLFAVLVMLAGSVSALVVSPLDMNGWIFWDDQDEVPGTGTFVVGPGTPPLGFGSAQLTLTDASDGQILVLPAYQGLFLADITLLGYDTYQTDSNGGIWANSLQFNVDYNCTDADLSWQGRLVYEPYNNGVPADAAWQTWSPLSGNWWATGGPGVGLFPQGSPASWSDILTMFPEACVHPVYGAVLFKAGSGWGAWSGNVDALYLNADEYDFEGYSMIGNDCYVQDDTTTMTWTLMNDCTTDHTILIPDGYTFDGNGFTITAIDPVAGHFLGAVVANDGSIANVMNLGVTADGLANVCDGGDDRLRGIMFDGASGVIENNNVWGINQGLSGCQEGNAIEVRNEPFDGTHPDTQNVLVKGNQIMDWQKTGILVNGDVDAVVENNNVGESYSNKYYLAPNSIQIGFGARATVKHNNVEGSSWCGPSAYVGTAMLLYDHEDGTIVSQNNIKGDSDIGIYNFGGMTTIDNNKVFEDKDAEDCNSLFYDIGIGNWGAESSITNNKVKGFEYPYDGVVGGKNKVIQGPSNGEPFW